MSDALILDTIEAFLARDVAPYVHALEKSDTWPAEMVARMRELGLFGATIGARLRRPRPALRHLCRDRRAHRPGLDVADRHLQLAPDHGGGGGAAGAPSQKREFLPRFAAGELRGGLALTEPDCGTDLQAIRTTARRDGDHYVINGTKTWISNGIHGSCFALLVKTDLAAEPRHRGMSLFLAEKGPGFTVSAKQAPWMPLLIQVLVPLIT